MNIPNEWPKEMAEIYEPMRELGRGGFGAVVLARNTRQKNRLEAIKVTRSTNDVEVGYAHREMDILKEISHPNIMKIYQHWETPTVAIMALQYANGPTLQNLLDYGGRLSLVVARVVISQLVDAVAALHARCVIHRDLKPDNVIISGSNLQDNLIWDDWSEAVPDWASIRKKYHVTLVDFGFARALTPSDYQKGPPTSVRSLQSRDSILDMGDNSRSSRGSLTRSRSRHMVRTMSAVGNALYAAPEILHGIKPNPDSSRHHHMDITQTLASHVSYYGLMADAYSMGYLIKYCITGAPPDQDVQQLIALENSPVIALCRMMCSSKTDERRIEYRPIRQIPPEVVRLIRGLTRTDTDQRTTIRSARRFPWIDDVLLDYEAIPNEISYLSFTIDSNVFVKRPEVVDETEQTHEIEDDENFF